MVSVPEGEISFKIKEGTSLSLLQEMSLFFCEAGEEGHLCIDHLRGHSRGVHWFTHDVLYFLQENHQAKETGPKGGLLVTHSR